MSGELSEPFTATATATAARVRKRSSARVERTAQRLFFSLRLQSAVFRVATGPGKSGLSAEHAPPASPLAARQGAGELRPAAAREQGNEEATELRSGPAPGAW